MASDKPSFFAEMKRRNVLRAAVLYIGAVWAISQGISQLTPAIGLPASATRWFLIACVIGFPFWIAFAWFYEFTPHGIQRESTVAEDAPSRHSTARKLDFWIIGILAVAVVLLVTNQVVRHRDTIGRANTAEATTALAALAKVPAESVAVLPLANESGDPKQQYFSDGLSEDLISNLAQINGLKVIGKYSSFQFRDSKKSPVEIGAALGATHLIQGSVSQQGDRIQIRIGMIRVADGASVWSHSYDEPLESVFAIQSNVAQAVAAALKIKLVRPAIVASDKPPSGNPKAYQLMLQGRALVRHGTEDGLRQGIAVYQQVLKLGPKYAYAWGLLSNASVNLGVLYLTGDARQQAYAQARMAVGKEQMLAPDSVWTHLGRGYLLAMVDSDPKAALTEYWRAYTLSPNNSSAMNRLASALVTVGQMRSAAKLFRRIIATDPLRVDVYSSLAGISLGERNLDAAEQATRKALALRPALPGLYTNLVEIDILRGDAPTALSDATSATDPVLKAWALAAMAQIAPDPQQAGATLHDFIDKQGKDQPYLVADLYAMRKQPDQMFDWLQRAWTQHDPNISSLLSDPFVLPYQHDPRFAGLCKQVGLPLPEQPLPTTASTSGH